MGLLQEDGADKRSAMILLSSQGTELPNPIFINLHESHEKL